jgi:methylenetetrahydrofolate dehydrogenase (NADP+)/methenyltetrahydrofolate cyclohydrolase
MIVDGRKIAEGIVDGLQKRSRPKKFLAAVLVGENPESVSFLKQKEQTAKELGVDFRLYQFENSINQDQLRREILKIASHKTCGGVIVQLPLPPHLNKHYVLNVIPREKDIDVLGERALGAFYNGRNPVLPPAVGVVEKILQITNFKLQDAKVAVVGLGFLVGKPIALWLVGKAREIYLLDQGGDFGNLKKADLVISGVGKPNLIEPAMLKGGAGLIDFGYSFAEGKICGDFNTKLPTADYQLLRFFTETPGGTGPILVAQLFENFYKLNLPT